jgi:transcriptional regulator with XRE-family HTH domain
MDDTNAAMSDRLAERVRQRLKAEKLRLKFSDRDLAGMLGWSASKVDQKLNAKSAINLDELEALCFALSLAPSEAVRDPGLEFIAELTPLELRVLEHYRDGNRNLKDAIHTVLHVRASPYAPQRYATEPPELRRQMKQKQK